MKVGVNMSYICQKCGAEQKKFVEECPKCGGLVEERELEIDWMGDDEVEKDNEK